MKSRNIILVLLLLPFIVQAQSVKIKKGQVLIDKKWYASTDCGGAFVGDCKVKTPDGKIFATLILNTIPEGEGEVSIYEITFLNTDYKAQQQITLGYPKKLMKEFYEFEVLKNGKTNMDGIKNFAQAYSKDLIADYKGETSEVGSSPSIEKNNKYKLVERDRTKNISLSNKEIKQADEKIGYYSYRKFHDNAIIKEEYKFYLPDGKLIAKAVMEHFGKDIPCQLTTIKDNDNRTITVDSTFEKERVEIMVKYLVARYYL